MEPVQQSQTGSIHESKRIPFATKLIATGFFSGYIPWASGTFGSLVGVLIYLIPGVERAEILAALIFVGFGAGVFTSAIVARAVGNQLTASAAKTKEIFQGGTHAVPDPSIVVIDEIVGVRI